MSKLRDAARSQDCQIRVPGICEHNPETVVLAHYRLSTGMGLKPLDLCGSWACNTCHAAVDGRFKTVFQRAELDLMHLEGMVRTIGELHRQGKLK